MNTFASNTNSCPVGDTTESQNIDYGLGAHDLDNGGIFSLLVEQSNNGNPADPAGQIFVMIDNAPIAQPCNHDPISGANYLAKSTTLVTLRRSPSDSSKLRWNVLISTDDQVVQDTQFEQAWPADAAVPLFVQVAPSSLVAAAGVMSYKITGKLM